MTRTLTDQMRAAIAADGTTDRADTVHLISCALSGGTVYLTTAPVDVVWNGHTWQAVGGALAWGTVPESPDLSAASLQLTLSGVDPTVLQRLLAEGSIARAAQVWRAKLTASGAILADPLLLFSGLMSGGWQVTERRGGGDGGLPPDGGTVEIVGTITSRVKLLDRRAGIQTNVTSHQAAASAYVGDQFFSFVQELATKTISWGKG